MGTVIHGDGGVADNGVFTLWKYTATNYADLLTKVGMVEGDLSIVYNSQGVWLINRILKGVYIFQSGVWVYANQELQDEIGISQYKVKIDNLDSVGGFLENKLVPNVDTFYIKSVNPNKTLTTNIRANVKPVVSGVDPTVNDDSSVLDLSTPVQPIYRIGQLWTNTVTGDLFSAKDLTPGAAVWDEIPTIDDVIQYSIIF